MQIYPVDNIIHFSNSWALYFGLGDLAVTKEGKGTWYSWKDSSIQVIVSTLRTQLLLIG